MSEFAFPPGYLVTPSNGDISDLMTAFDVLKGAFAGQTSTDVSAILQAAELIIGSTVGSFPIQKAVASTSTPADIELLADDAGVPSAIEDGYTVTLEGAVGDTDTIEGLGSLVFIRTAEDTGDIRLYIAGIDDSLIHILSSGEVGIFGDADPDIALRIHGTINSTEIRQAGLIKNDWSETTPGTLDWDGNAKVIESPAGEVQGIDSGAFVSTVDTGTAPLIVASTTVCNLPAELLDGETWHPGVSSEGGTFFDGIGTDWTLVDFVNLDRAGDWFIRAVVTGNVDEYAGSSTGMDFKLEADDTTAIGNDVHISLVQLTFIGGKNETRSAKLFGAYNAATDSDSVNIYARVTSAGAFSNSWLAQSYLVAQWTGP